MTEKELVEKCLSNDSKAQKLLYERYSGQMFGICRRYLPNEMEAEDIMIKGFYKAFTKMKQFKFEGDLGAWLRRIMVNEALMELRKKRNFNISLENTNIQVGSAPKIEHELASAEILSLLDLLPVGYRTVFNLFAIEGYSHEEIAKKLKISVNTSKSQLLKARKRLKEYLKKYNIATA